MPIIIALAILSLLCVSLAYGGYVFTYLWTWFVVPLGVPNVTVAQACGLMLMIAWPLVGIRAKLGTLTGEDDEEAEDAFIRIAKSFCVTTMFWGIGWLFHWLMT